MGEFRDKPKYGGMLRGYAGHLEHDEQHAELNRKHFDESVHNNCVWSVYGS